MSDLRDRLIGAASKEFERGVCDLQGEHWWGPGQECGHRVGTRAADTVLPIIEAELQKRDGKIERLKEDVEQLRATQGLPLDLVNVLRDQSVITDLDQHVWNLIGKPLPPSTTASSGQQP